MKKLYGRTIDVAVYKDDVPVFYGDKELMSKWAESAYGKCFSDIKDDLKYTGAYCFMSNPKEYKVPDFIYLGKSKNNYGTIAHELLHYALFLLNSRDVYINEENQYGHEALTYLLGFLMEDVYNNKFREYDFKKKKWIKL